MKLENILAEQVVFSLNNQLNEANDPINNGLRVYVESLGKIINANLPWRCSVFSPERKKPFNFIITKDDGTKHTVKVCQRRGSTKSINTQIKISEYGSNESMLDNPEINEICILCKPKQQDRNSTKDNTKACFFDTQFLKDCLDANILKLQKTQTGLMLNLEDSWVKKSCQYMIRYVDKKFSPVFVDMREINTDKIKYIK